MTKMQRRNSSQLVAAVILPSQQTRSFLKPNMHQTTTSLMPLSTPASDEEEKFKPTRKACKPKGAAPARKSRAPAKKTPKHDSDADVAHTVRLRPSLQAN